MRFGNPAATAMIAAAGMILFAGVAVADPPDPHIPDIQAGRCWGGDRPGYHPGYCSGQPYVDGTYWYWVASDDPNGPGTLTCVIGNGTPVPSVAPPGGCGGAWRG